MWEPPLLILSRRLNQRLAGIHVRAWSLAGRMMHVVLAWTWPLPVPRPDPCLWIRPPDEHRIIQRSGFRFGTSRTSGNVRLESAKQRLFGLVSQPRLALPSCVIEPAAFVAANLANADPNKTGWVAMAFGWTLFVIPFIFVYSPTLLMKGDPLFIFIDSLTAVAGVWFISAAVMGYSLRAMGWIDRLPHAIVGVFC
jgi:hypothetical protein